MLSPGVDTRDMHADGLTKGTVDRWGVDEIMAGRVHATQENETLDPQRNHDLSRTSATYRRDRDRNR